MSTNQSNNREEAMGSSGARPEVVVLDPFISVPASLLAEHLVDAQKNSRAIVRKTLASSWHTFPSSSLGNGFFRHWAVDLSRKRGLGGRLGLLRSRISGCLRRRFCQSRLQRRN